MQNVDCTACCRERCPVWGDRPRKNQDMECSGFIPSEGIVVGAVYKHYKGNKYRVLYTAKHTETGEDLIIYTRLYDPTKQVWARPSSMWNDTVVRDGKTYKRFELVEDEE